MNWRSVGLFGLVAALSAVAVPASAADITGHLNIGGVVYYQGRGPTGGPSTGQAIIGWDGTVPPPGSNTGSLPAGFGDGTFFNVGGATGYFAGIPGLLGSSGSIVDLTNDPTAVKPGGPDFYPLTGAPSFLADFLSAFTAAPGLHFDLTDVPLQSGIPCAIAPPGSDCTEGVFKLSDTGGGVRVLFDVAGNFVNGGDSGAFTGAFSTTFTGYTLATFEAALDSNSLIACGVDNDTPCSFDANFDGVAPAVPEPATLLMFGTGSLALTRLRRRKK